MKSLKMLCLLLTLCLLAGGAAAEAVFKDLGRAFETQFLPKGSEWSENGYQSENLSLQIETHRVCDSDVYVAQIWVRTAESMRRAFGSGVWNASSEKLGVLAAENNAILALSGDNSHLLKAGYLVGNGQLWRSRGNNMRDLCVLYTDGTMKVYTATPDHERLAIEAEQGMIWQTFVFGPGLLDENGKALEKFTANDVEPKNPRAVIGYYEPGHYCLVQVDGRGTFSAIEPGADNEGMTMTELAQFMESIGCKAAYNLDGGQSAAMWFRDDVISTPYHNGRAVGDAIVICEPQTEYDDSDAFLVE